MPATWIDQALSPFSGLAPTLIALMVLVNFLGFFVRGAFGFGSNLPIVLLTTPILGPHHAIVLAALTAVPAAASLVPQAIADADYRVARPLVAGIVAGTALGAWVFVRLPGEWLLVVMGTLIICVLTLDRTAIVERWLERVDLRASAPSIAMATAATASGTVSGGGTMYLLVVYLRLACRDAVRLRATNLLLSVLFQCSRALAISIAGVVSIRWLAEATLLLPVAFVGTWAGTRYFRRSSPQGFATALHWLLLIAATSLLARGVLQIAA